MVAGQRVNHSAKVTGCVVFLVFVDCNSHIYTRDPNGPPDRDGWDPVVDGVWIAPVGHPAPRFEFGQPLSGMHNGSR